LDLLAEGFLGSDYVVGFGLNDVKK